MFMIRWNETARVVGRVESVTTSYGSLVFACANRQAFHNQIPAPLCVWWYHSTIVLVSRLHATVASRGTNKLASSTAILNNIYIGRHFFCKQNIETKRPQ